MSSLSTPTLYRQNAFDARYDHTFQFVYDSGSQAVKNRLVIRNNLDNNVLYDATVESFKLEHTVAAGTLANGGYYNANIQVFDNAGNASEESMTIVFYCYANPQFYFNNLSSNEIITGAVYDFSLTYLQSEGELLNQYQVVLYDGGRAEVWNSGLLADEALGVTITGLENNSSYYLQGKGETVHGIQLDTGLIPFSVTYHNISPFAIVIAENQYENGCIRISSNIVSIQGRSSREDLTYLDGTWVDLSGGEDWVVFDEGFQIADDFMMSIVGRHFTPYVPFLELRESEEADTRLLLTYMLGTFNGIFVETAYIKLDYYVGDAVAYTLQSQPFDISLHRRDEGFVMYLKRVKGLFQLEVVADRVDPYNLVHRFTQDHIPLWRGYNGEQYLDGIIIDDEITV